MKRLHRIDKGNGFGPTSGSSQLPQEISSPATQPSPDDFSVSLRAEMLPASDIKPEMRKFRSFKVNPAKLKALLLFLVILGLGWLFYFGPARPGLEKVLSVLVSRVRPAPTATSQVLATSAALLVPSETLISVTPTTTPQPPPTATPALIAQTPTNLPSETPASECVDVLTITLGDVGKVLCMRGIIQNFEESSNGFLIAFSGEKGAMYWVSYDLVWTQAQVGLCVESRGEIMQIATSPVLVFGYQNQPIICDHP